MVRRGRADRLHELPPQLALSRPRGRLPRTDRILSTLCDMRIPLTFSIKECEHIKYHHRGVFDDFVG